VSRRHVSDPHSFILLLLPAALVTQLPDSCMHKVTVGIAGLIKDQASEACL
jgi:hypothetical protein